MSDHAHAPAADTASKKSGGGMMGQIKVAGIIAGIVLAQCGLAYFLLPSAPVAAAAATDHGKGKETKSAHGEHAEHGEHDAHAEGHGDSALAERREADLGRFSITAYDQTTNNTILIDFHMFGAVLEEPKEHKEDAPAADAHGGHGGGHGPKKDASEEEDTSKFGKLLKKNKHRFRDQVIVIVRNTSPADLADPALGLIKRQILAKTNSLLGEPLLKEVIFSEFSVVQQ
jgi:hypothetical protein